MSSPFFLVGPTAVGKSSLAVEIAARSGAEIVGADAFQVYEGLDLLTAKPSRNERERVPHHLIGTLPLSTEYNVARYLESARRCLDEIIARGRPALVVGGCGLYIRALTHGLPPLPPAQPELRAELEQLELPALVARLQAVDGAAVTMVDTKNKRRLIRAIEICEGTGQLFSATRSLWEDALAKVPDYQGISFTRESSELHDRIHRRVQSMVSGGVLEEVRAQAETEFSSTSSKIIGLSELRSHLRGDLDLPTCLNSIEISTRQYAKRQRTWFRGKCNFETVDLSTQSEEVVILRVVECIQRAV